MNHHKAKFQLQNFFLPSSCCCFEILHTIPKVYVLQTK